MQRSFSFKTVKKHFLPAFLMAAVLLSSAFLSGCSQNQVTAMTIKSEDCVLGNLSFVSSSLPDGSSILRLGNGIYYNAGSNLNLHYYDLSTQKDVILCNKPECKHDGNEYCVATNGKYHPLAFQVYSGSIFATVYCMDDEKLEFMVIL